MKKFIKLFSVILMIGLAIPGEPEANTVSSQHYLIQVKNSEELRHQDWIVSGEWEVIDTFELAGEEFASIKGPAAMLPFLIKKEEVVHAEWDQTVKSASSFQTKSWGHSYVKAEQLQRKGCSCKIAVIDTGVNDHDDLKNRIVSKVTFLYDYEKKRSAVDDSARQHGTHVAGIIAANNNRFGTLGVDPSAQLLAVKVLDENGEGYLSDIGKGIEWSMNHGADVINLSLGLKTDSKILNAVLKKAYDRGIIIVAAAGNEGGKVYYPASSPYTIAVGAVDKNGVMPGWANYGPSIDVMAPGVSIISTIFEDQYEFLSGTSMAAPFVSATAGKILITYSGPKNGQRVEWVRSRLKSFSQQKNVTVNGEKREYMILNAYRSYYGK